jgi:hypothetical protein
MTNNPPDQAVARCVLAPFRAWADAGALLFHDTVTVRFDRSYGRRPPLVGNLLVRLASDYQLEDLALAGR